MKKIHAFLDKGFLLSGGAVPQYRLRLVVPSEISLIDWLEIGRIHVDIHLSFARLMLSGLTRG